MIEFAPQSPTNMSFDEAFLYCLTLNYKGHKDWSIPYRREKRSYMIGTWSIDDIKLIEFYYSSDTKTSVFPIRGYYES
jgi:hypothetical protein